MISFRSRPPQRRDGLLAASLLFVLLAGLGTAWCSPPLSERTQRIASLLHIREGTVVADVGAGDGQWSLSFARRVGTQGHVFATEISSDKTATIRRRARSARLDNVTVILGSQEDTGLPAHCCDVIFLRNVYHHFTHPAAMRHSLLQALRPDGRIGIIDFKPTSLRPIEGVPKNRGGHGISSALLIEEMKQGGFVVSQEIPHWQGGKYAYFVIFERSRKAVPSAP